MKVETEKFKNALNIAKPAISAKEIIEQTTSFAFIDGYVVTYNDEVCIRTPLQSGDLQGVIKAEELYKFINKVKEKEFDVKVVEQEIVMRAGKAKVGFALNKEILLPLEEVQKGSRKWKPVPENFEAACKITASCASTDMSDPKLTCVHITKEGIVESSNNYRIAQWNLKSEMPIETVLIPASSIREAIRIHPILICESKGWVHFKNGEGTELSCRVFDETYVDTKTILSSIGKTKKITLPDGLVPVLEKAEIFVQENKGSGYVELIFSEGELTVKSESDTAWFKEVLQYDGDEEFTFSILPYLLKDILKETNVCHINKGALKFESKFLYVSSLRTYQE